MKRLLRRPSLLISRLRPANPSQLSPAFVPEDFDSQVLEYAALRPLDSEKYLKYFSEESQSSIRDQIEAPFERALLKGGRREVPALVSLAAELANSKGIHIGYLMYYGETIAQCLGEIEALGARDGEGGDSLKSGVISSIFQTSYCALKRLQDGLRMRVEVDLEDNQPELDRLDHLSDHLKVADKHSELVSNHLTGLEGTEREAEVPSIEGYLYSQTKKLAGVVLACIDMMAIVDRRAKNIDEVRSILHNLFKALVLETEKAKLEGEAEGLVEELRKGSLGFASLWLIAGGDPSKAEAVRALMAEEEKSEKEVQKVAKMVLNSGVASEIDRLQTELIRKTFDEVRQNIGEEHLERWGKLCGEILPKSAPSPPKISKKPKKSPDVFGNGFEWLSPLELENLRRENAGTEKSPKSSTETSRLVLKLFSMN